MSMKKIAPFGSWASPIGTDKVSSAGTSIAALAVDGEQLYWLEARPLEGGRNVIVERKADGETCDITPEGFNVRTRVHEYGGGAFIIDDGTVYFSNFADQRLYAQTIGTGPRPLTPEGTEPASLRYADAIVDRKRGRLICVREDHRAGGEPINALVAIDLKTGGEGTILFGGTDFISSPRLSPDGSQLAFVTWDHPNMPWDVTSLHVAALSETGTISEITELKQPAPGSITQPRWAPDGRLYFVADWSNWWNLYRYDDGEGTAICAHEAEFASPPWTFGQSSFIFRSPGEAIVSYTSNGAWQLATLDVETGGLNNIGPATSALRSLKSGGDRVYYLADSIEDSNHVFALADDNHLSSINVPVPHGVASGNISRPESIAFQTAEGETAYGFFYPPANDTFGGPEGTLPPLLVKVHGGPTGATSSAFGFKTQYWTSRGFAILDLNYRGSTGFGRAFRQKLYRTWGIADVEDACAGAEYLVRQGRVDGSKLAISGGSAGGLTVLNCLAHYDTFSAGGNFFGVADLKGLAEDTHKFESRYTDYLIGRYPEEIEIYEERSPINSIDKIKTPLLILQGLEDLVVPPSQSEAVFEALTSNGVPVCYIPFEGEQHGFRRAENIERAISAELGFYGHVFDFNPAEDIKPLEIVNADQLG